LEYLDADFRITLRWTLKKCIDMVKWIHPAQDRVQVTNMVMGLHIPLKKGGGEMS
jgi:hypothetical protein